MLNILHINGEMPKSVRLADGGPAAEATETIIRRHIATRGGRASANGIYDRARGIYFRARRTQASKALSIF